MSGLVKEASAQYQANRHSRVGGNPLEADVPDGYKRTEVGIIPEDWDIVEIESIAIKVGSGKTPKGGSTVYKNHGRPLVRSQNIGWGRLKLDEIAYISEEIHETFLGSELRAKDVLLNITGASIGRCSIANKVLAGGNVNQHVCIIRVDSKKVDSRIILNLILSSDGQHQIESFQAGGNREGLNFTQVKALRFAISKSIKEQTAIANALSDVDALITSLEKLIAKKRTIKTAAMQQLLTGKKRLPPFDKTHTGYKQTELAEIPEDWKVVELGESVVFLDGVRRPVKSGNREKMRGIYRYYGASGIVDYVNDYLFDGAYVLLGEDGENILSRNLPLAFKVEGKFWVNNHAHVMQPKNDFNIDYITAFLESLDYSLLNSGTAQPKLNKQSCISIKVVKPRIKEQNAIAEVLIDMDKEIETLEQRLNKTQQLKQGMMQELLTGRTRLV